MKIRKQSCGSQKQNFEDLLNHVRRTPVKSRGVNPEEKDRRDRRMVMHFIITNEIITIIIRLSLIVLLSGIIGFEREFKNHPAGLRTHILVGVGSCLLMLMSLYGFESYLTLHPQVTRYDPSRIPSYVISGIGFLGAGSIIIYGGVTVKGLTTAASIWTVAGLGLVVGVGMYFEAVLATIIIITTLLFLDKLEAKLAIMLKKRDKNFKQIFISMIVDIDKIQISDIHQIFTDKQMFVVEFNMEKKDIDQHLVKYNFKVKSPNNIKYLDIAELFQNLESVYKVQIEY
jgi:putative Mg2+ transporter-C (MgtC) family protein